MESQQQSTTTAPASAPKVAHVSKPKTARFDPRKSYRPEEIASTLNVSGKVLRSWLRARYPRKPTEKNTSWSVPGKVANEYAGLVRTTNSASPAKRTAPKKGGAKK